MNIEDYKSVLKALQQIIDDAKSLMTQFEGNNIDQSLSSGNHTLHELYQRAVSSQKTYTHEMLDMLEKQAIAD
ncbi:hypothetical protein [Salinicola halophyticus]|uniref:hypothetical protein n=1 Tax=Salinicola halophyticus TaxID=1808881 RepID=UPI000DA15953|nr:hypothetical protein [Salinicola halophyticus]